MTRIRYARRGSTADWPCSGERVEVVNFGEDLFELLAESFLASS